MCSPDILRSKTPEVLNEILNQFWKVFNKIFEYFKFEIFEESSPGDPPFFSISLKSTNFSILNFLQFCTYFIARHLELFGQVIHIRLPTVLKLLHCLTYFIRLDSENVGWIDLVFSNMIVRADDNGGGSLLSSFLDFGCRLHLPTAAALKQDMVLGSVFCPNWGQPCAFCRRGKGEQQEQLWAVQWGRGGICSDPHSSSSRSGLKAQGSGLKVMTSFSSQFICKVRDQRPQWTRANGIQGQWLWELSYCILSQSERTEVVSTADRVRLGHLHLQRFLR